MTTALKNFRKSQNMTVNQMSESIGISKSYYEKVESGQRSPSFNFVKKFKQRYPQIDTDLFFFSNKHTKNV